MDQQGKLSTRLSWRPDTSGVVIPAASLGKIPNHQFQCLCFPKQPCPKTNPKLRTYAIDKNQKPPEPSNLRTPSPNPYNPIHP